MALNLPNFLGAPIVANDYSGLRDALKNFYGGYEMAQTPMKMQNERQNEALRNALLQAQGQQVGIQNQYLPDQLRLQNALSGQQLKSAESEQEMAKIKRQHFMEALSRLSGSNAGAPSTTQPMGYPDMNQGGMPGQANQNAPIPMRSAVNAPMQQQAPSYNQGGYDQGQRFADAALVSEMLTGEKPKWYPDNDAGTVTGVTFFNGEPVTFSVPTGPDVGQKEEQKELGRARAEEKIARNRSEVMRQGKQVALPNGAVDMYAPGVSAQERTQFRKDMREDLETARSGVRVLKKLDTIEDVLNRNPNLYKSWSAIVNLSLQGKDTNAVKQYMAKNLSNKKDLADVEIFAKNANDLVLDMASNFPRATDSLRSEIAKAKTDPTYTDTANRAILKSMREQYAGYPGWVDAINDGSHFGFAPIADPQNYIDYKSQTKGENSENFQRGVDDLTKTYTLEELRQLEAIESARRNR